jgi:hypothetical protein
MGHIITLKSVTQLFFRVTAKGGQAKEIIARGDKFS